MLTLTNSLSHKKEIFSSISAPKVKMYVCGITPYAPAHIGHGRCYVTFDLLYRLLTFLGHDVTYCRNITDIDDKLIIKAEQEYQDPLKFSVVADTYIAGFRKDLKALNCLSPDHEPRVTAHIPEIINFIADLIKKGFAYEIDGDVYFQVREYPAYGRLSNRKLEEMRAGERVEIRSIKKDPLDFALWKHESDVTYWSSPWGNGRPGWHIECSALAHHYLGKHIDIHGGGLDLLFPHHENEIAQSQARFGGSFSRFWIHNGFVQINKEKMSKSIGNVIHLHDLFTQVDPMVVRFYLLTHQYRMPIDFSFEVIEATKKSYERICTLFDQIEAVPLSYNEIGSVPIIDHMLSLLCDDLNTPGMFGILFESFDRLKKHEREAAAVKFILTKILGLTLHPVKKESVEITPEIQKMIDDREEARKNKDWKTADILREKLAILGVVVQDKKLKE